MKSVLVFLVHRVLCRISLLVGAAALLVLLGNCRFHDPVLGRIGSGLGQASVIGLVGCGLFYFTVGNHWRAQLRSIRVVDPGN